MMVRLMLCLATVLCLSMLSCSGMIEDLTKKEKETGKFNYSKFEECIFGD